MIDMHNYENKKKGSTGQVRTSAAKVQGKGLSAAYSEYTRLAAALQRMQGGGELQTVLARVFQLFPAPFRAQA